MMTVQLACPGVSLLAQVRRRSGIGIPSQPCGIRTAAGIGGDARHGPAAAAAPGLVSVIHLTLQGGTKELAERGGEAPAGVPHLQEARALGRQELPARPWPA